MIERLESEEQLEEIWDSPRAIIYKHSTQCPISAAAWGEIQRFDGDNPEVPIYMVDVIKSRPLAGEISDRTAVRHHSPQVILLRDGVPEWDASHSEITAAALEKQWKGAD